MRPLFSKIGHSIEFAGKSIFLLIICVLFVNVSFAQKKGFESSSDNTRMVLNTFIPTETLPVSIPDNNPTGVNLTFNVSGLTGNLYHVRVENLTFSTVHTWSGDLVMTLAAPGGSPTATIFQRRGQTTCSATAVGSASDLAGPYSFGDGYTANFHTVTSNPVAVGNYRATRCVVGGTVGELVALDTAFAGPVIPPPSDESKGIENFRNLSPEAANGTWTLNVSDNASGDTGAIGAIQLALQTAAPVAANGAIKGQVVDANGRGISRARIILTDTNTGNSREIYTNSFGHFGFDELEVGHFFIISASHRRYQFANGTQSFTLNEDLSGIEFIAN